MDRRSVLLFAAEGGSGEGGDVPRKRGAVPPDFSKIPGGSSWEGTGWEGVRKKKRGDGGAARSSDFKRREPERAEFPRRVRGGLRVESASWPMALGVFSRPIAGLVDGLVDEKVRDEAFADYAQRGQVKSMEVVRGGVKAVVQGRKYRAYEVTVRFREYEAGVWDGLVAGLDARPHLLARLVAGEMPEEMLEFAAGAGAVLHPEVGEVSRETTSGEGGSFDKHAACVLMLLAELVEREPMTLLTLRGLTPEELGERLRQRRAVTASSTGAAAAYDPPRVGEAEMVSGGLDADVERFWDAGPELGRLEAPLRKPEVTHPILRRLGPSPFEEGKFPLVGLLATCYDAISDAAVAEPGDGDGAGVEEGRGGDGGGEGGGTAESGGERRVSGPATRSQIKAKARAKRKS